MNILLNISLLMGLLFATTTVASEPEIDRYVISTNTMNMEPVEDLEVTSFQNERMYILTYWKGLEPKRTYEVQFEIYDAMSSKRASFSDVMRSSSTEDRTTLRYVFKPGEDFPGDWVIKVFLNSDLKDEKQIYVYE
ncbi:hypothetical protein [Thalassolituus sp.]|uniref:hypothetical protein n=1 Tax=Thalassolituus sp. TaxID=2030822 RepID=UPI0035152F99